MDLDEMLETLAADPAAEVDLAQVALLIARDEYQSLDVAQYTHLLDDLAYEARSFSTGTFPNRVAGLCRFLVEAAGFTGNQTRYYDPRNSYLNNVLDRRTGIPITLSLITMEMGERLDLQIDGVGLPGHFIVMARFSNQRVLIDPFNNWKTLDSDECIELVQKSAGVHFDVVPELLEPATAGSVVVRMLSNLKGCYLRVGDFRRAARTIRRLVTVCPTEWNQRRDLGTCLFQDGQAGAAIDHLQAYVAALPEADDAEIVSKLLRQAKSEVARWN